MKAIVIKAASSVNEETGKSAAALCHERIKPCRFFFFCKCDRWCKET